MAERDVVVAQSSDAAGGAFQVIAVVEDTQATTDPRGRPSPTVVAVRLVNTSARRGVCTWQTSQGAWVTGDLLSGENSQTNIAPPRREYLHVWASRMSAHWGTL